MKIRKMNSMGDEMMKIMWMCNTVPVDVANKYNLSVNKPESWITAYLDVLTTRDVCLIIIFSEKRIGFPVDTVINGIRYITYSESSFEKIERKQEIELYNILMKTEPDVVHIFGTEYPHSLAMVNASEKAGYLNKTVISVQGLVSVIAKHYYSFLPANEIHKYTLRDFLKGDNIYRQKRKFEMRGEFEIEAIRNSVNVIGRTTWDYACVKSINPQINYYFCEELLRTPFYTGKWQYDRCNKYSIFITQCGYPIKGFHLLLESLDGLVKDFPQVQVYLTGKNLIDAPLRERLRHTSYQRYIANYIVKHKLKEHITFLGSLNGDQIKEQLLRCNVFVSSSTIENSPNSLAEAMILGVPIVASNVGGVSDLLIDKEEGFLYQADAPYMLEYYIRQVFNMGEKIDQKMLDRSIKHARESHDPKTTFDHLIGVYEILSSNNREK